MNNAARITALRFSGLMVLLMWPSLSPFILAEETNSETKQNRSKNMVPLEDVRLNFQFRHQPWADVIQWFADEAEMSLVMDHPPVGTFNYSDYRDYSVPNALDLLNGVLLTKGYTLVRRDRLLMLIPLDEEIPPNLVPEISLDELDQRGEYELVRALISLESLAPEVARAEITELLGPQGKITELPRSGQLYVTETAGRLRTIHKVITALESEERGGVRRYTVPAWRAQEIVNLLQQILGVSAESMASPNSSIRLVLSESKEDLFVYGPKDVQRRTQEFLDAMQPSAAKVVDAPQFEVYPLEGTDPKMALQILQTLLAGVPSVRLALHETTNSLAVLAPPGQHASIRATLQQLREHRREFEVIRLRTLDPETAAFSISNLFAGTGDEPSTSAPLVDADYATRQLLIRGTPAQIAQIRELLRKMGEPLDGRGAEVAGRRKIRTLPFTGPEATSTAQQLQQLWSQIGPNRIHVLTPTNNLSIPARRQRSSIQELTPDRSLPPEPNSIPQGQGSSNRPSRNDSAKGNTREQRLAVVPRWEFVSAASARQIATNVEDQSSEEALQPRDSSVAKDRDEAPIFLTPTPRGLVITSDDLDALDQLEEMANDLFQPGRRTEGIFTVFYLKHARAELVATTVRQMLSNVASNVSRDAEEERPSLRGVAARGPSVLHGDSSIYVQPDARLNALIVRASQADVRWMRDLLEVLDQPGSPEEVLVQPKARLIPITHTSASEVAEVVKEVYKDRLVVVENNSRGQQGQRSFPGFPGFGGRRGRDDNGGRGSVDSGTSAAKEPGMTVGVDERSNSLVVAAPDPLFQEVRELVAQLDAAGVTESSTVRVVALQGANSNSVQQALVSLLGENVSEASSNSRSGNRSSRDSRGRSSGNDSDRERQQRIEEFRRRMEFFRGFGGRGGGRDSGGRSRGGSQRQGR